MEEDELCAFNWNIEYHDGYYFFISACKTQGYTGNVLKPYGKFCCASNKLRVADAKMIV